MLTLKEFQKSYSMVLGKAWASEANMADLMANPLKVLNASGFKLPEKSEVTIKQSGKPENTSYSGLTELYKSYEVGLKTNKFMFYVPSAKPMFLHSGGVAMAKKSTGVGVKKGSIGTKNIPIVVKGETSYCCCCCPCCTCT